MTHPPDQYCPHEVRRDLETLGFVRYVRETEFGDTVFYVRRVDTSDQVTLFIHGVASVSTTWTPMLECANELKLDLGNAILVDMPGFGDSENLLDSLHIPAVGQMMIDLARTSGFRRIRLVGHSMGGFLALDMAKRFEESVTSVHVAAGSYFAILNTIKRPLRNLMVNPVSGLLWDAYWALCHMGRLGSSLVTSLVAKGLSPILAAPFVAHPRTMRKQVLDTLMLELNPRGVVLTARNGPTYNAEEMWGGIKVPVFAVFGRRDRMVTDWDASCTWKRTEKPR